MPNSLKMSWPYPSQDQDPWYDAFVSFVEAVDADVHAQGEGQQLVLHGGGDLSFSGNTFTWTENFYVFSPSGRYATILPNSVTLFSGQIAYVPLTQAMTENQTVAMATGNIATGNHLVVAVRLGTKVVFRNGWSVNSGETVILTGPKPVEEVERFQRGYINQHYATTSKGVWQPVGFGGVSSSGVSASSGWFTDYLGTDRWFIHYDTAASSGSSVGIKDLFVGRALFAHSTKPHLPIHIRTGSDITQAAILFGVTDGGWVEGGSGLNTEQMLRFRYTTTNGDTNWKVQYANGVTLTTVDTGVAVVADTAYYFVIDGTTSGQIRFYVNDVLAHTATTNLPASTLGMTYMLQVTAKSAAVRSFKIGSPLLVEHNL